MNLFLYICVSIIWGMTWIAIKLQLGEVPLLWSLIYRFGFAAIIFFIICLMRGDQLRFSPKQHFFMALLGLFLFCANYILFYIGSQYLISGLVAVIAASLTIMNVFNSRVFLKNRMSKQVFFGSVLGLLGLVVIFYSKLKGLEHRSLLMTLTGFGICLIASYIASIGNILVAFNKRKSKIPVLSLNAYGMFYGSCFMLLAALLLQQHPSIDVSFSYLGSLLFLSLIGTVVAFQIYLVLLERIGPEKVGYVFIITPIVALVISSWFEMFVWTVQVVIGIAIVLIGNALVLYRKSLPSPKKLEDEKKKIDILFDSAEKKLR